MKKRGDPSPPHLLTHVNFMTDSDRYWTFITAQQYAGSFFKALAEAGLRADPINRERLLMAFPEVYASYGPASRLHRRLREGVEA